MLISENTFLIHVNNMDCVAHSATVISTIMQLASTISTPPDLFTKNRSFSYMA